MHPKPVPLRARVTPLQVKDMILGVFPGLHSEIEELMTWKPSGEPLEGTPDNPAHAYILAD